MIVKFPNKMRLITVNRNSFFLKNFLNIESFPSLRILNLNNKIKRFKFIGDFNEMNLEFFAQNYIGGNPQNY